MENKAVKGTFFYGNKMGLQFEFGKSHVWSTFPTWTVADLVDDNFVNHFKHNDLEEAIKDCVFRNQKPE